MQDVKMPDKNSQRVKNARHHDMNAGPENVGLEIARLESV